jgi:hypothetical protein
MFASLSHAWVALQIDSKKELEKLLKATCEVFIMAVTKLTVEPMLSFITKVTAVRVASSVNPGRRLREQVTQSVPLGCFADASVPTALKDGSA